VPDPERAAGAEQSCLVWMPVRGRSKPPARSWPSAGAIG